MTTSCRSSPRCRAPSRSSGVNRLAKAIADFDAATIETTHGFCLQVLYGLGTAGDVDRDVTLVEDVRDLVDEVVDDLYLRKFAHRANTIGFSREEAGKVARKVLDIPDAHLVPPLSDGDDLESTRRRFAERVRTEMEKREARPQDPHVRRRPPAPARHPPRSVTGFRGSCPPA